MHAELEPDCLRRMLSDPLDDRQDAFLITLASYWEIKSVGQGTHIQ